MLAKTTMSLIFVSFSFFAEASMELKEVHVGLGTMREEVQNNAAIASGDHVYRGAQLALEEYKTKLLSKGLKVKLVPSFYSNSELSAVNAAGEACKSSIAVMHGYDYSSHSIMSSSKHISCKLPMVTPTSTASSLGRFDDYIFQIPFNNEQQARFLSSITNNRFSPTNVLVLTAKDCAYCNDLGKAYVTELKKISSIAIYELSYLQHELNSADLLEFMNKNLNSRSLIFLPSYGHTAKKVVNLLKDNKVKVTILGSDGWSTLGEQILQNAMSKSKLKLYKVAHWHKNLINEESQSFLKKYTEKYKTYPTHISALSFDTMSFILEGIINSKKQTREELNEVFKRTSFTGVTGLVGKSNAKRSIYLVDVSSGKIVEAF